MFVHNFVLISKMMTWCFVWLLTKFDFETAAY